MPTPTFTFCQSGGRRAVAAASLFTFSFVLCTCHAAPPLRWDVQQANPKTADWYIYRGESVDLMPRLVDGTHPAEITATPATLRYREPALAEGQYRSVAATNIAAGTWLIPWTPALDSGAPYYDYQLWIGDAAANNRITGRLVMRESIGVPPAGDPPPPIAGYATPADLQAVSNALAAAMQELDFAQIALTNAPWLTTEHDPVWQAAANRVLYRDKVNSVEYENFGLLAFDMDHWLIRSMFLQPDKLTYSSGGEWSDSYGTELSPSGLNASFSFGDSSIAAQFRARGLEVGNGELHLLYPWPGLDPANPQSLATLESVASHNTAPDSHQDIRQMIADLPRPPTNAAAGWYVWDSGSNCYWRVVSTNLQFYVYPD